ncbi:hypothetical protein HSACCH_00704 [Halanaerobium saccharolyticum subsp. saccharolyticum DSM 6643]|uniref:Uncharacterized protein n=1 Tax=Halanaerobium saccharolyticum subsp. saccharolyticum DSM 6643 TaxID=1293054 RepID=M5DZD1_9FIRM|nr:hypothetical protein HSACCH_00704 [Halanaerobium saccharolyticum subsp. saccharolyticum DSM 6643]
MGLFRFMFSLTEMSYYVEKTIILEKINKKSRNREIYNE